MTNTLLRVTLISIALSAAIKFGAPLLAIPANNTTATIGVLVPVLLVALTLWWRQIQKNSSISK
jgi:membrane protein implicated in regulation of membrane protease activity